jgi:hypothetical protein
MAYKPRSMRPRSVLDDPAFQSAFLAVAHLIGSRSAKPMDALSRPDPAALALDGDLGSTDRAVRAGALGRALERIARKLEERRLA